MTAQELLTKYTAFELKWKNKYLESYDANNKYQCFDVINEWLSTLGLPKTMFPVMSAYQIYTNFGPTQAQYFTRIANGPNDVPQPGDIMVWSYYYNYTAGHTGLCSFNPQLYRFNGFVQNDPPGQPCIVKNYDYGYVLGWLRLKTTSPIPNADKLVNEAQDLSQKLTSKVDEVLKSGDPQGKQKLSTVKRMCEDIYKKL